MDKIYIFFMELLSLIDIIEPTMEENKMINNKIRYIFYWENKFSLENIVKFSKEDKRIMIASLNQRD